LYGQLEQDFVRRGMTENWAGDMHALDVFLFENFKRRSMGLLWISRRKSRKSTPPCFRLIQS